MECSIAGASVMLQGITLDQDTAEQLRLELAEKRGSNSSKSGGKARGPVDSGKGVRVQVSRAGANCKIGCETSRGLFACAYSPIFLAAGWQGV